ncbi:mycofactocin biosynthesis peptidyl-dipeptidase MftE [Streptomyces sp. NBC_00988]|uniref:mycofactocin biosynthesis peptidyl-dipeptidase MftE n=1 Tax=Streptomyces sp. NBC_00988 TaxID=2903704 RepID=UPI00386A2E33|nr:mycofactocin biosynthesis peptidyl-dipeptidase MftE [Streptomyces sp. NBC_00988]
MTPHTGSAQLSRMAWPALPERPLVLVPLGSFEQHGPHLPLDTDTRIADAVARGAAGRLRQRRPREPVVVAPSVVYAASGEHQSFPGTISIGNEALRFMLVELVRSMCVWSGRIVFVNAHGGNLRCLAETARQLTEEGQDVAWVPCQTETVDAHAGHTETSLMLHLVPDLVDMTLARKGNPAPIAELLPAIIAGGVSAVSPSGVLGDPTTATAEGGARVLDDLVADVATRIEDGRLGTDGRLCSAQAEPCRP